ncbi:MAG TPA: aspartate aminotransferase family protein [Gemmataceae bacterium]|nr:aspartate aminotransferase family protein [Gemmataceae bacterium]
MTSASGTSPPTGSPSTGAKPTALDDQALDRLRRACAEPLPHPDPAAAQDFAGQALDWVLRHLATLRDQPIGRYRSRAEMEALLREPPPEVGTDFARVLAEFHEKVAPHAMRTNHPRFLAFIPGAPSFFSVLGDLLCAGSNFFAAVWLEACGPAQVEIVVLDWFKEFLGLPPQAQGILTGGGSEATLTALVTARERLDFEQRGRAVLYLTEQRHWSVDRAARVIGLRPDQLRPVPADGQFRLDLAALAEAVARDRAAGRLPWAVVANAGATNTGAVDPLAVLADFCHTQRLWLHVDAAYGWAAALTAEGKAALDGIDRADSITLDPHKWFAQTFEAGCLLVRDGSLLARTFAMRPEYMQDVEPAADEINFADYGLALTRRFRALKIWLSVKVLGVGWFRSLVAHCCRLADFAQALLERSPAFEVLSPRQLSIVCFRYVPPGFRPRDDQREAELDRLNLVLLDRLRATGRAFLSSTRLHGRVALRLCFVNWRTTAADVEEVLRLIQDIGRQLSSGHGGQL